MGKQYTNRDKKTGTIKLVEYKFDMKIEDLLKQDYTDNRMTIQEIADKYGVMACTVHRWLVRWDIPRRHISFQ